MQMIPFDHNMSANWSEEASLSAERSLWEPTKADKQYK